MDQQNHPQGRAAQSVSEGAVLEQLVILYSRSLKLLSDCSFYVPEDLKDDIEQLAQDSRKAAIPVRVERANGMIAIDPYGIPG
jgi:hypothetical protein